MSDKPTFADAVREGRAAHEMSQADLAEACETHQPAIARIEDRRRLVSEDSMHKIAAAFGERVSEMLKRVGL